LQPSLLQAGRPGHPPRTASACSATQGSSPGSSWGSSLHPAMPVRATHRARSSSSLGSSASPDPGTARGITPAAKRRQRLQAPRSSPALPAFAPRGPRVTGTGSSTAGRQTPKYASRHRALKPQQTLPPVPSRGFPTPPASPSHLKGLSPLSRHLRSSQRGQKRLIFHLHSKNPKAAQKLSKTTQNPAQEQKEGRDEPGTQTAPEPWGEQPPGRGTPSHCTGFSPALFCC